MCSLERLAITDDTLRSKNEHFCINMDYRANSRKTATFAKLLLIARLFLNVAKSIYPLAWRRTDQPVSPCFVSTFCCVSRAEDPQQAYDEGDVPWRYVA